MIGIYKITNKINGKIYIGQSNNIKRRFLEHKNRGSKSRIIVDVAIQKYGIENFTFEVLEECSIEQLNEKESYWINYFNSIEQGYNCSIGGDFQNAGSNNGRAILNEEDVKYIREAYSKHLRRKEVYELFKNKISFNTFAKVWDGSSWSNVMPEVFTEENKNYYKFQTTQGGDSSKAAFTNDEVIKLRERYVTESARSIYADYQDRCSYNTL